MSGQLRAERLKQRTTATNLGLLLSMISLIAAVVLLHMLTLPAAELSDRRGQLKVFGLGTTFGMIFALLLGAISVTGEFRHGVIRLTFMATSKRARVIVAKVAAIAILGATFGLLAEALAAGGGSAVLATRGIYVAASASDFGGVAHRWLACSLRIGGDRHQRGRGRSTVISEHPESSIKWRYDTMTVSGTCTCCDALVTAEDEDEFVLKVQNHANDDHGLNHVLPRKHILARLRVQEPDDQ